MPQPARTTSLSLNFFGLQARPILGAMPHCRPVKVVSLTPLVPNFGLFPATSNPFEASVSVVGSYEYFDGSKFRRSPFFSVNPPFQSNLTPAVIARLAFH